MTRFNNILTSALVSGNSKEPDSNFAQRNYQNKYDEMIKTYQNKLNKEVVEFESASKRLIRMPSIGDRGRGAFDLINKLRTFTNRRYRDSFYEIFRHISSSTISGSKLTVKNVTSRFEKLLERRTRQAFNSLKDTRTAVLVEENKTVQYHKRTIIQTMKAKQHILFSKLLHNFVSKSYFVNCGFFFVRLSSCKGNTELMSRVKNLDRQLRKIILKRLAPAFDQVHRTRLDNFSGDSIDNLASLMEYHISNRLSIGFSSIKSFFMEFQVLQVEEVPQDDYKSRFLLEAMDKFKVLSDRSFDLNNLSGVGLDENPTHKTSTFAMSNLNVLEPVTAKKTSSRAITKR